MKMFSSVLIVLLILNCYAKDSEVYAGESVYGHIQSDSLEIIQEKLQRAILYRRNGEFSKVLDYTPLLISYAKRHHNSEILEWGYILSGHANLRLQRYTESEYYYRKVLEVIDLANAEDLAMAYNNLGNLFRVTGEYEKAVEYLEKSLHYNKQVPENETALAINYLTLSQIYAQKLNFNRAIDYNIRAQNTYQGEHENLLYISILSQSGRLMANLGFYENALAYFEQVAGIAEAGGFKSYLVDSYFNLGTIYSNLKKNEIAAEYFEKYLPYLKAMQGHTRWNRYLVIADFYSQMGKHQKAEHYLNEAKKATGNEPSSLNQVQYLRSKGQILSRAGMYTEANEAFESIFKNNTFNYTDVTNPLNYWNKMANMFHIDRKRAFEISQKALHHTERERRETGLGSSITSGFYERYHRYYVKLARQHIQDGRFYTGADLLEMARSRAFRDDLIVSQIDLSHLLDDKTSLQVKKLSERLYELEQDMLNANPAEFSRLEIERSNLERNINILIDTVYRDKPGLLSNLDTPLYTLEQVRKELGKTQGVLQFGVSENQTFVLLTTGNRHYFHNIEITGNDLVDFVTELRESVIGNTMPGQLDQLLEEAGRVLFGDISLNELTDITILLDGALNYLPFEMIRTNGRYLIEFLNISYTPSLSVREILKKRGDSPNTNLLVLVNPDFGVSVASAALKRRDIRPLPYAELEGRMITSVFPGTVELFSYTQASERLVKQLDLKSYRILHMATHGIMDDRNPRFSGIVLSTPDEPDYLDDGFLRLGEIYDLKLDADLVVLSACDTGLGKIINGEGIMGLQRAFMFAGARSVAVSLWNVFDRSTAILMHHFYEEISKMQAEGGTDYSIALRNAKLSMIRGQSTSHPVHWAPFILHGR